jgi:site-specific DNA recombinase
MKLKKRNLVQIDQIKRVVTYARVSTEEQVKDGGSLDAQLHDLTKFAVEKGYEIVEHYKDGGISGRTDNRPGLQGLLTDLTLGRITDIDAVLVFQSSRFMRDTRLAEEWKYKLGGLGVRVIDIQTPLSDGPMVQAMEKFKATFDQLESDMIGIRVKAGLEQNAREGYFNGARPPFGFERQVVDAGGRKRARLAVQPDEADQIRQLFTIYTDRRGAKATAEELNKRGHRHRGGSWDRDKVLRVLDQPAAYGVYRWRSDRDPIDIAVEPIIDRELFELAQQIRAQRDPKENPGKASSSPLLLGGGLVKCGQCGKSYCLEMTVKHGPHGPRRYRYYNCRTFIRAGRGQCRGFRVRCDELEKEVLGHLAEHTFTEERLRAMLKEVVDGELRQAAIEQRRAAEQELARIRKKIFTWMSAFEDGRLEATNSVQDHLRELEARRQQLEQQLKSMPTFAAPPAHLYTEATMTRFRAALRELVHVNESFARNYINLLVDQIIVTPRSVRLKAKAAGALKLLATTPKHLPEDPSVLADVSAWSGIPDSNRRPSAWEADTLPLS